MPAMILRAAPYLLGAFGLSKVDDISEDFRAAMPWLAAALVAYLLIQRGR